MLAIAGQGWRQIQGRMQIQREKWKSLRIFCMHYVDNRLRFLIFTLIIDSKLLGLYATKSKFKTGKLYF
jgi:hypothetical protein